MEITQKFYAKTAKDWRAWLEKNVTKKKEIWLVYYKKHTGKPTVSYDEAVSEALCFGWIDSTAKSIDDEKYAQRFTPRNPKSQWSENNVIRYRDLVKAKKMTKAGRAVFTTENGVYGSLSIENLKR